MSWLVRYGTFPFHQWTVGRKSLDWLRRLNQSQWWEEAKIRTWQEEKLRFLLTHAMTSVPYYKTQFRPFSPEKESLFGRFQDLPLLSKETARKNFQELQATDQNEPYTVVETSGSTGFPMKWHIGRPAQQIREAARLRARGWWELRLGDPHVWVWGDDEILGRRKAWRDLLIYNKRVVRLLDLSKETIEGHYRRLCRWKPTYLYGYPSGLVQLAQLCEGHRLSLKVLKVRGLVSTAEILTLSQRDFLEAAFDAPVINEYGCAEAQIIAFQCPQGRMHLNADTLIVEFLKDGRPVQSGEQGEIVVTDLFNEIMPLIRYQTGDVGIPRPGRCPCGRTLPLMDLNIGREVEMIRLPDGRTIHPEVFIPPYNIDYFKPLSEWVERFRVIQEGPAQFRVQVVTQEKFFPEVRERFKKLVEHYLGKDLQVEVDQVNEISRDPSGKPRYFISKLNDRS